jgi:hypothetical protein
MTSYKNRPCVDRSSSCEIPPLSVRPLSPRWNLRLCCCLLVACYFPCRIAVSTTMQPTDQFRQSPPNHIQIPPPPVFLSFSLDVDNSTPDTPSLQFHTAPSTPSEFPSSPSPPFFTPPTSPFADNLPAVSDSNPPSIPISVPHMSPKSKEWDLQTDDAFPVAIDVAMDLVLDDEGLSPLEKIYLYSRSKASFHRIFIAHAIPDYLHQITPQDAVEYVLPLLSGLAMDEGMFSLYFSVCFFAHLFFFCRRESKRSSHRRACSHHFVVFHSVSICYFPTYNPP